MFTGVGKYYCICEKSRIKSFVSPEGAVPQVMSLGSTLVGAEDKFENDKTLGVVELERQDVRQDASLAPTRMTHPNLQPNCCRSSCMRLRGARLCYICEWWSFFFFPLLHKSLDYILIYRYFYYSNKNDATTLIKAKAANLSFHEKII